MVGQTRPKTTLQDIFGAFVFIVASLAVFTFFPLILFYGSIIVMITKKLSAAGVHSGLIAVIVIILIGAIIISITMILSSISENAASISGFLIYLVCGFVLVYREYDAIWGVIAGICYGVIGAVVFIFLRQFAVSVAGVGGDEEYADLYEDKNQHASERVEPSFGPSRTKRESGAIDPDVAAAFELLGLNVTATASEIEERYRFLVKRFHPDSNDGNRAFESFLRQVFQARENLRMHGYC